MITKTNLKVVAGERKIAPASENNTLVVPKLQRNTLNEEVYEQLKQALMSGQIEPGSTMTIRSLSASFGISPMPVREALRHLVAEHVLELLPNRSVTVPVITVERFREITRIRMSLEGLAAAEAAPLIGATEIRQMAEINKKMEVLNAVQRPDYLVANREFHFLLYQNSQMPTLVKMIEALWLQIGPLLTLHMKAGKSPGKAAEHHHRAVLEALSQRDAAKARKAIESDLEDAAKVISESL
ncbi:GntR family transcriptional regulator [Aestuariivirga sp.]|uniref:GntR family transcriptional regulator n=1 Tax=Aestuariivirga sp. TaxID=2650926 RepID=UPI0039E63D44